MSCDCGKIISYDDKFCGGCGKKVEYVAEEIDLALCLFLLLFTSGCSNIEKQISPNSTKTKAKGILGATGQYTKIPENKTAVSISLELKNYT